MVQAVRKGDRRSVAELISKIENLDPAAERALASLYPYTGKAHVVGLTGPPGCGKSTLILALTKALRSKGHRVGIIAIDPTSHYSGGALLGDRIRMQELSTDDGVYIRSMATRGVVGGVARATRDAIRVLDAAGMDEVLVETAGAGQTDVKVERIVQTTVVVLAPGLGDEVQVLKAGLMEIGDIYVVNKADDPEAAKVALEIESALSLAEGDSSPGPVIKTVATKGVGIDQLISAMEDHGRARQRSGDEGLEEIAEELNEILALKMRQIINQRIGSESLREVVAQIANRKLDPYTAASSLIGKLGFPVRDAED